MQRAHPRTRRLVAASPPRRALLAALAAVVAVAALPGASHATDMTLRMAFANILNGPLDSVTSPYTGGHILVNNLQDIDDSRAVRVTYAVPGYIWLVGLQFGCGGIRTITGALETIPGVLLFPFENDMDEIFSPAESSSAILVDWENEWAYHEAWYVRWNPVATLVTVPWRFGLNYTRADY